MDLNLVSWLRERISYDRRKVYLEGDRIKSEEIYFLQSKMFSTLSLLFSLTLSPTLSSSHLTQKVLYIIKTILRLPSPKSFLSQWRESHRLLLN